MKEQIIREIETNVLVQFDGFVSLAELGIKEENKPIVIKLGQVKIKVTELRAYQAVLSILKYGIWEDTILVNYNELPISTLRFIQSILKEKMNKAV
jgi:hypothetical protein